MCEIRIEDDAWVGQLDWKQVAMGSSWNVRMACFNYGVIKVIQLRWEMVSFGDT